MLGLVERPSKIDVIYIGYQGFKVLSFVILFQVSGIWGPSKNYIVMLGLFCVVVAFL